MREPLFVSVCARVTSDTRVILTAVSLSVHHLPIVLYAAVVLSEMHTIYIFQAPV